MYATYYFFHIVGVIIWVGAFISFGLLLRFLVKERAVDAYALIVKRIDQITKWFINPSAFIVLISGVLLLVAYGGPNKPLYITIMERAGSLVILLSIIALTLVSRKIKKAIGASAGTDSSKNTLKRLTDIYGKFMLSSAVLACAIIVVVSMKI